MLHVLALDVCLTSYSPLMARVLVDAGEAVIDPPHRDGGYRIADHDADLYDSLLTRSHQIATEKDENKY